MNCRILFVIEDPFPLGANLLLKPLVVALAARGFDIHVFALKTPGQTAGAIANWPVRFHSDHSATIASRTMGLRNLLREIRPQFMHAWGAPVHLAAMFAAAGNQRIRLIASHFERPPRQRLLHDCPAWLFGNPAAMTAIHPVIANRIQPTEGIDQPIQILPSAFAPGPFDRSLARQRLVEVVANSDGFAGPETVLVGTVARLEPVYRLKDLVWAIDLLCCVRDDVHLFIFGSGSVEQSLKKFISTTAATSHIHLIPPGRVHENDLAGLDIYWNAQTESPLQPAMLTAMSLGIPTISVLADETVSAVLPLTTALATNYGARDEFARWTKYLIEQTESAKKIAAQGQSHVEKLFPAEKMIDGYAKLYQPTR